MTRREKVEKLAEIRAKQMDPSEVIALAVDYQRHMVAISLSDKELDNALEVEELYQELKPITAPEIKYEIK